MKIDINPWLFIGILILFSCILVFGLSTSNFGNIVVAGNATFDENITVTAPSSFKDDLNFDQDDYLIFTDTGNITYNGSCMITQGKTATLQIC